MGLEKAMVIKDRSMMPYHYALLRYIHQAAAEEFVNVGVALWMPDQRRFLFELSGNAARLKGFFADFDVEKYQTLVEDLRHRLQALASSEQTRVLIVQLRRAIPDESAGFSYSLPMGGITLNAERRVRELYEEYVGKHEQATRESLLHGA